VRTGETSDKYVHTRTHFPIRSVRYGLVGLAALLLLLSLIRLTQLPARPA